MEISTFELIFKPQAPGDPNGATPERVLQGYFLAITNLEPEEYAYAVEFIAPSGGAIPANRALDGNTVTFVDLPGSDNQGGVLQRIGSTDRYRLSSGLIRIPGRATALLAVLPNVFGPTPLDPTPLTTPNFEVRGWVRIRVPARLQLRPPRFVPQADRDLRVLLTPQNRAVFFSGGNMISDQVQATLPLAAGGSLTSLTPELGFGIVPTLTDIDTVAPFIEGLTPEFLGTLAGALLCLTDETSKLDALRDNARKESGSG